MKLSWNGLVVAWGLAGAALVVLAIAISTGASAKPAGVTVIENVTVITGDGSEPQPGRSVMVKGGRIAKIAAAGSDAAPRGAKVIDGSGKYLLPGFIDTHAHIALGPVSGRLEDGKPVLAVEPNDELTVTSMRLMLSHGITSARDPGGVAELTVGARERQKAGQMAGPRFSVAGDILDLGRFDNLVAQVSTEEDLLAEIRRQSAEGVDWIKLYSSLPPEMVKSAIMAAHDLNLKVTGHLDATTWTEAARYGIDSIVHILPGSDRLLPEDKREAYNASRIHTLSMLKWFELADFNAPEIQQMLIEMAQNEVSVDPTLVLFHAMANGDRDSYRLNPALDILPPEVVQNWRTLFNFNIGWTAEDFETARRIWPRVLEFTKLLHDNGVMLTVGTDANNPWVVPGESYHRELALLESAGIEPLEVLKLATLNGAILLGLDHETGTVEEGKLADLVLLDADPVEDIANTKRILWVMQGGEISHPWP